MVLDKLIDKFETVEIGRRKVLSINSYGNIPKRANRNHYFVARTIRKDDNAKLRDT